MKTDNSQNEKHYSLDELCALTETSKRTVRFYMGQGLMDRSEGQKKGAFYLEKHLLQLLEIKKWQQAGLSLERIKDIMQQGQGDKPVPPIKAQLPGTIEVWSHMMIADGIQLHIEPNRAGLSPEDVRALVKKVNKALEQIKNDSDGSVSSEQE